MPSFPDTAKLAAVDAAPGSPATVEGLVNFRDLGGRRRRDGTLTPHGVFFRSETVDLGGVLFHCMAGRDRTGMTAMVLLAAVDAEPEEIRDDYFETVRNADAFAAATGRPNPEAASEKLCAEHGTSMDGALRGAVDGFSLQRLFDDAEISSEVRDSIRTWRGTLPTGP